jgi:hypothetical protein
MAQQTGVRAVIEALKLRGRKAQQGSKKRTTVMYTAPHATFVHENLEAHHDNGEAKFLENATKAHRSDMAKIVALVASDGGSLDDANLAAGEALLGWSNQRVPVLTGELKASGTVVQE